MRVERGKLWLRLDTDAGPATLIEPERHVVGDRMAGADIDIEAGALRAERLPQMIILKVLRVGEVHVAHLGDGVRPCGSGTKHTPSSCWHEVSDPQGLTPPHGRQRRKLVMSPSPRRWLFSGWNCVPAMLSRATMAVTGPP